MKKRTEEPFDFKSGAFHSQPDYSPNEQKPESYQPAKILFDLHQFLEVPPFLLDICSPSTRGLVLLLQKTMWLTVPRSRWQEKRKNTCWV